MTVPPRHHDTHEPPAGAAMPSLLDSDTNERDDPRLRMLANLPAGGQAQWHALLSRRTEPRRKARLAWATGVMVVGAVAVVLVARSTDLLDRQPAGAATIERLTVQDTVAGVMANAPRSSSASLPALVTDPAPLLIDRPATDPWQALAGLPPASTQPGSVSVSEQRGALSERETARIETSPDPVLALARSEPVPATTQRATQGNAGPPQVSLTPSGGGLGAARPWGRSQGKAEGKAAVKAKAQAQGKPPARQQGKSPTRTQSKVAAKTPPGAQAKAGGKAKPGPHATTRLAAKRPASGPAAVSARRGTTAPAAPRNDPDVDLIAALIGHMDDTHRPARSTGAPVGRADASAPRQAAETNRSR